MSDHANAVLSSSHDAKQVVAAALMLARSPEARDHRTLESSLSSEEVLLRLDSPEEYAETGRRLRLQRVLQALADNPAPSAKSVLVGLTRSHGFLEHPTRIEYLLRACAGIRPAPPEVVRFWDRFSQPDDGFSNVAMDGAVANGSAPAMQLLEQKLADDAQPEEDREHWIHCYILEHRIDPGVLAGCRRMLTDSSLARFHPMIIDVLFDYRPVEWFAPATVCKPPGRDQAGPEARQLLREIASQVAAFSLTPEQKQAITKTLIEIE